ncbi:MAG: endonuclease domain-containing protein [Mycobacteriales bacterium]
MEVFIPVPHRYRPIKGIRFTRGELRPEHVTTVTGLPVLTPVRAAIETARRLRIIDSVPMLDAMAHDNRVAQPELLGCLPRRKPRIRGYARAEQAILLMDPKAESPQESRLRVMLTLQGLPPERSQHEVWDADSFIARVDFAWPRHRLAVEYDGSWHAEPEQQEKDVKRHQRLVELGWTVLHVTVDQMRSDFSGIMRAISGNLSKDKFPEIADRGTSPRCSTWA